MDLFLLISVFMTMDLCDVKEVMWRIVDLVKAVYAWVRSAFGNVRLEKAKMLSNFVRWSIHHRNAAQPL